jgi:hypothetical protein
MYCKAFSTMPTGCHILDLEKCLMIDVLEALVVEMGLGYNNKVRRTGMPILITILHAHATDCGF